MRTLIFLLTFRRKKGLRVVWVEDQDLLSLETFRLKHQSCLARALKYGSLSVVQKSLKGPSVSVPVGYRMWLNRLIGSVKMFTCKLSRTITNRSNIIRWEGVLSAALLNKSFLMPYISLRGEMNHSELCKWLQAEGTQADVLSLITITGQKQLEKAGVFFLCFTMS